MKRVYLVGLVALLFPALACGGTGETSRSEKEEVRLTIVIEEPDDTTRIQIPLAWMEVGMDILKVLAVKSGDTSATRINWDSLKVALRSFRGEFFRVEEDSERVLMYIGTPEMHCPCLEMTGKSDGENVRLLANLDMALNVLKNGEIEGLSPEDRDRLLKFLDDPRPGESMDITNTQGDTIHIRIVGHPVNRGMGQRARDRRP